jgi:uncharacterized small protein (DUF1192 family)
VTAEVNIPDEAVNVALDMSAVDEDVVRDVLAAAMPLIRAAELEQQAGELRAEIARLRANLDSVPDEAAFAIGAADGALSKQARRMEDRAAELRGESR